MFGCCESSLQIHRTATLHTYALFVQAHYPRPKGHANYKTPMCLSIRRTTLRYQCSLAQKNKAISLALLLPLNAMLIPFQINTLSTHNNTSK